MVKKYNDWVDFNLNEEVQFPTDHDEIEQILRYYEIENYSIRPDGTVDVNRDVDLDSGNFEYFPVKFGIVKGIFKCSGCDNLKTLEGAPEKCNYFSCEDCINLKTLEGAPKECIEFNCACCVNLETLRGAPKKCVYFVCYSCSNLKTIKDAPKNSEFFYCYYCENLKTLEGSPSECAVFNCVGCDSLKSLKGAPRKCSEFACSWCRNLEYSFEFFPRSKVVKIDKTPFEKIYKKIGNNVFIDLINSENKIKFESILAYLCNIKRIEFDIDVIPLLDDKKITEREFIYKYRGFISGIRYNF